MAHEANCKAKQLEQATQERGYSNRKIESYLATMEKSGKVYFLVDEQLHCWSNHGEWLSTWPDDEVLHYAVVRFLKSRGRVFESFEAAEECARVNGWGEIGFGPVNDPA